MRILLLLILCGAMIACSKDNGEENSQSTISSSDVLGKWSVSYFEDSGTVITSTFNDYTLEFTGDQVLTITKEEFKLAASWVLEPVQGDGKSELYLNIPVKEDPLNALREDWDVRLVNGNTLEMTHKSDEDGSIDRLHLFKM